MTIPAYPDGIWLVDFEFHPKDGREGNPPVVVCMVARNILSGVVLQIDQRDLYCLKRAPFPVGETALFVAYYAPAEMSCFLALNWPLPANLLDLFVEFRTYTNGKPIPAGNGLIGALSYFGLAAMAVEEKSSMRELILSGGPWNPTERLAILNYCLEDVIALETLFTAMKPFIDWPRALLRGQYSVAAACIEANGVPIDTETLDMLQQGWDSIQQSLIERVDQSYGVYEGRTFRLSRFKDYLVRNGIPWPRLPSGEFEMSDDTFKDMARAYPQLTKLRELRVMLGKLRLSDLTLGDDGRNRCSLSIFRSKTGRNQPSNARFIFGPSTWMRGLIKPLPNHGLAYVDWSQQEFGIAAALSRDDTMLAAYRSGDPYLAFAKQAGALPDNATKTSHSREREQFKACVLAVQYGMGAESLAVRINQPIARARQLLLLHRQVYRWFWQWSDAIVNEASLGGRLWTVFGWQLFTSQNSNDRSLRNFPMQSNGAEMLRIACIELIRSGIRVCAPIHDAILIEAPLEILHEVIQQTQAIMRKASATVLSGFELASDTKIVRYPARYMDERGVDMWNLMMELHGQPTKVVVDSDNN
jgi:DNA polymerase-1